MKKYYEKPDFALVKLTALERITGAGTGEGEGLDGSSEVNTGRPVRP